MTSVHAGLLGLQLHEPFTFVLDHDPVDDGPTVAGQYWLDISGDPFILRRRNDTNDGWVDIGGSGSSIFERSFEFQRQTAQAISDSTDTAIVFSSANNFDLGGWWDVGNPTRMTVPTDGVSAGRYVISGSIDWEPNATGTRKIWIVKNGTSIWAMQQSDAIDNVFIQTCYGMADMAEGDYFELFVRQESGGALNAQKTDFVSPTIRGHLVH